MLGHANIQNKKTENLLQSKRTSEQAGTRRHANTRHAEIARLGNGPANE